VYENHSQLRVIKFEMTVGVCHRALHPMSNWQLLGGTAMGEGAFSNIIKKHSNRHALLTAENAGFAINFEPKKGFFPITAFRC